MKKLYPYKTPLPPRPLEEVKLPQIISDERYEFKEWVPLTETQKIILEKHNKEVD